MNKVREYREMDKQISMLKKRMDSLQSSEDFQKTMEFEENLRKLMNEHDVTVKDVLTILGEYRPRGRSARRH